MTSRASLQSGSEAQTIALGEAIGRALLPGDLVLLHGDLGSGKTRLTRGIAAGAGADPSLVSSPTFVIMQEYPCRQGSAVRTLVHVDAYRLTGADELDSIGWERIAAELQGLQPVAAIVEWAERLEAAIPRSLPRLTVRLSHVPDGRLIEIDAPGTFQARAAWRDVELALAPPRTPTRCPVTGKPVSPDSPTYPFYDEHARMADLGRWLAGSYTVSRDLLAEDEPPP